MTEIGWTEEVTLTASDGELEGEGSDRVLGDEGAQTSGRVASVDALRGLTIFLMIFVNDLGPSAPSWLHHIRPSNADGMTLADAVFPAFLFIVGVSIPLALPRGPLPWPHRFAQLGHILTRTLGLLFMGVMVLNAERRGNRGGPIWGMLAFMALLGAWCSVPRTPGTKRVIFIALKSAGVLGLIVLLAVYRSRPGPTDIPLFGHVADWAWLRTEWWGILGLIGWAYLTAAILWLVLGRRREWLMAAASILMLLHLAMRRGGLFGRLDSKTWLGAAKPILVTLKSAIGELDRYVSFRDAVGSLAAISVLGCLLGSILRRDSDVAARRDRVSWASIFTLGLLIAGLVCDSLEGINKIAATPTWCLWSAAAACAVWIVLYLILDVWGARGWAIVLRPAGANPLVAYFLHPITVVLISVLGLGSHVLAYQSSANPYVAAGGSAVMALVICAATGLLARLGLLVRL